MLNSIYRTGNTFLAFAFREAVEKNYHQGGFEGFLNKYNVYNHAHSPMLLKMPVGPNLIQFTNVRHPDELIPSLVHFNTHIDLSTARTSSDVENLKYQIEITIQDYAMWLQYILKYQSTAVIKFKDITDNIHGVLKYILSHVGLEYDVHIDEAEVKNYIDRMNRSRYVTEDAYVKNHHLPRGIEQNNNYKIFKEMFLESPDRNELIDLYYQAEKRATLDPLPLK